MNADNIPGIKNLRASVLKLQTDLAMHVYNHLELPESGTKRAELALLELVPAGEPREAAALYLRTFSGLPVEYFAKGVCKDLENGDMEKANGKLANFRDRHEVYSLQTDFARWKRSLSDEGRGGLDVFMTYSIFGLTYLITRDMSDVARLKLNQHLEFSDPLLATALGVRDALHPNPMSLN